MAFLKGTIDGIPNELVEAAYIDGASVWQTFVKIMIATNKKYVNCNIFILLYRSI